MAPLLFFLSAAFAANAAALPNVQPAAAAAPSSGANITAVYLQLLTATDWVSFVESRVQGWPGSLDGQPPLVEPYGLWWGGGDTITKAQGTTTFAHQGTDDNGGIITSPVMEGVCFAATLWPSLRPRLFPILESLVRGFTAWMLAMQRTKDDPAYPLTPLLARNLFPPDGAHYTTAAPTAHPGVNIAINTSRVRHGTAGEFSGTIHVPDNPYFGDLWVQVGFSPLFLRFSIGKCRDCPFFRAFY